MDILIHGKKSDKSKIVLRLKTKDIQNIDYKKKKSKKVKNSLKSKLKGKLIIVIKANLHDDFFYDFQLLNYSASNDQMISMSFAKILNNNEEKIIDSFILNRFERSRQNFIKNESECILKSTYNIIDHDLKQKRKNSIFEKN